MCASDACGCCTNERILSLTQNHALHAFLEEESAMDWGLFDALWASDITVKVATRAKDSAALLDDARATTFPVDVPVRTAYRLF